MKPIQIANHSYTGSLSSYSCTTDILFFQEQNIVAKITKYERDEKPIIHLTGGNEEDRLKVEEFLNAKA